MIALQDFRIVFGNNLTTFAKRSVKGLSIYEKMMIGEDSASNRMPIRLQIEITDRCSHECIMCNRITLQSRRGILNNDISFHMFEQLIENIKPFYITLNGLGEPLLHKEIDKILSFCRSRGITTSLPSNLSVSKILNTKIIKYPPNIITFSVHGASKEIFESISRKSNFEECIATLHQFLDLIDKKAIAVQILCALQAKNLLEYKNMYSLLKELGLIANFCLVPVYDYCMNNSEDNRIIPTQLEKEKAIILINKDMEICKSNSELAFYANWKNTISQIVANDSNCSEKINKPCLIPWFSTHINAIGNVLPCCYITNERYVMGNINKSSFDKIWNGEAYRKFRNNIRDNRTQLNDCNYCSRDDSVRIKNYGFLFKRKTLWKI